jgi:hypothetical protein
MRMCSFLTTPPLEKLRQAWDSESSVCSASWYLPKSAESSRPSGLSWTTCERRDSLLSHCCTTQSFAQPARNHRNSRRTVIRPTSLLIDQGLARPCFQSKVNGSGNFFGKAASHAFNRSTRRGPHCSSLTLPRSLCDSMWRCYGTIMNLPSLAGRYSEKSRRSMVKMGRVRSRSATANSAASATSIGNIRYFFIRSCMRR